MGSLKSGHQSILGLLSPTSSLNRENRTQYSQWAHATLGGCPDRGERQSIFPAPSRHHRMVIQGKKSFHIAFLSKSSFRAFPVREFPLLTTKAQASAELWSPSKGFLNIYTVQSKALSWRTPGFIAGVPITELRALGFS